MCTLPHTWQWGRAWWHHQGHKQRGEVGHKRQATARGRAPLSEGILTIFRQNFLKLFKVGV